MMRRFVSIWFRYLNTDWFSLQNPEWKNMPFVLRSSSHGRMIISSVNSKAEQSGIFKGMVLADARAIFPEIKVLDEKDDLPEKLLKRLAEWCIRFTPFVAIDPSDGLFFDATGCTHLWGGEQSYLQNIIKRLSGRGYEVKACLADTPGVAWAVARYGSGGVIDQGQNMAALQNLPPEALRLEEPTVERLNKLGLRRIKDFATIPRRALRRRFGEHIIKQLDLALGHEVENLQPFEVPEPFQERLTCFEPVATLAGIEIALEKLLQALCTRTQKENKGIRKAVFKCFRVDGKVQAIDVGTNTPSWNVRHFFKLFELKIGSIDPGLGIELFVLDAPVVEDYFLPQGKMWEDSGGLEDVRLGELLDRIEGRIGEGSVHRFLPDEHYWPERSVKPAKSLIEKPGTAWRLDKSRPLQLLKNPEPVEVTAPIPDYPPMLFRHKGKLHQIVRADGPERIEQEWWIQRGQHRDYYRVEDQEGKRYWLFRLGHYDDKSFKWFIHGYFP
jgi:protein ImuB